MNKLIFVIIAAIVLSMTATQVYAEKSPYESGASHGEEDCNDISNGVPQNEVYYFKAKYGPDMHTDAFNEGFRDGWTSAGCSIQELNDRLYPEVYSDNNNNDVNAYRESFNDNQVLSQPQNQQAFTSQSAGCASQIINGDCVIGQEQKTNNEFAAANRGELND